MRKIEKEMVAAIQRRESRAMGNTKVTAMGNAVRVYLHGNLIAHLQKDQAGWIGTVTFAGWPTRTTASRINAIMEGIRSTMRVGQSKKEPEVRWFGKGDRIRTMPCTSEEWLTVGVEG